jgi:membrane fusion protein, multidrug efflux system
VGMSQVNKEESKDKESKDKESKDKESEDKESKDKESEEKKGHATVVYSIIVIVLLALIWFFSWLFYFRYVDSTDDAYVHGNQVLLNAKVSGFVTSINTQDTYLVKEGQVLVELDKTDYKIALDMVSSELGKTLRDVSDLFQSVRETALRYKEQEALVKNYEVEFLDRKSLVDTGAVSQEDFISSRQNLEASEALLEAQKVAFIRALNLVQNTTIRTHPLVEAARQKVINAWVNLKRCTIMAPATGIVAQRAVQIGQSVLINTPLMSIVPLNDIWVEANFRETDLAKVRIGQTVELKSDIYGDKHLFTGQVVGIGGGTGAVFSPLPPQNATGNWIKIVQRVPVRISVDSEQLQRFPLRLGLSMHVKVHVRNERGKRSPTKAFDKPIYETRIYNDQLEGVDKHIDKIFTKNIQVELELGEDLNSLIK